MGKNVLIAQQANIGIQLQIHAQYVLMDTFTTQHPKLATDVLSVHPLKLMACAILAQMAVSMILTPICVFTVEQEQHIMQLQANVYLL